MTYVIVLLLVYLVVKVTMIRRSQLKEVNTLRSSLSKSNQLRMKYEAALALTRQAGSVSEVRKIVDKAVK